MENYQTIESARKFARGITQIMRDNGGQLPISEPETHGKGFFTFFAGDMVIRIARYEETCALITKEAEILQNIHRSVPGVYTPRVFKSDAENGYMVTERLPGSPLTAKVLESLSQDDQDVIAEKLGKFLASFHAGPADARTIMRTDPWYSRVRELDDMHRAIAFSTPDTELSRLWAARAYVAKNDMLPDRFVQSHCDLNPTNIIYDVGLKTLGVSDFGHVRTNFAHMDFAMLKTVYPQAFVEKCAASYREAGGHSVRMDMVRMAQDVNYIHTHQPSEGKPFKFTP